MRTTCPNKVCVYTRRASKTCVCVCVCVCWYLVFDSGVSELVARRGGSHGASEPSWLSLFDLRPLTRRRRWNGRELLHKREEEEEEESFDLKEQNKRNVSESKKRGCDV